MYEICKHVNFMFQFGIIIDCPFTFQKILFFFFSKYPVFGYLPKPRVNTWVNTQKIFTYPLGIYPPHITRIDYHFKNCVQNESFTLLKPLSLLFSICSLIGNNIDSI